MAIFRTKNGRCGAGCRPRVCRTKNPRADAARLCTALALLAGLAGCAPAPAPTTQRLATDAAPLPAARGFPGRAGVPAARANADIARDFLDLAFRLESGETLPALTRFEEPVTLRLTGRPGPGLSGDLDRLLARLRGEAGLDIRRVSGGRAAITVEAVPRARIRSVLPEAACFVVPEVSSLSEYLAARRSGLKSWADLDRRARVAIFVPGDASPQEARDCLHEELAQALGPLNDLYRLPDSVFNDDNIHAVLTGFDMLILRAHYAPELANGMSRGEVAARLPALLARLNPAGERVAPRPLPPTPADWVEAIRTALGPGAGRAERRAAAAQAVRIAEAEGWRDHRRAFAHFALGRVTQQAAPARARAAFARAEAIYAGLPDTALHRTFVGAQRAAYALAEGDAARVRAIAEAHLPVAARHENAMLLATLLMLRAEALDMQGQGADARAVRLDSLGWARYGFGRDAVVRAKLREIAALDPTASGG